LKSVDGMAEIAEVARAIDHVLGGDKEKPARKKSAAKPATAKAHAVKLGTRKKTVAARSSRTVSARKPGRKAAPRGKAALRKSKSRRG
jgi:hypothetical protein